MEHQAKFHLYLVLKYIRDILNLIYHRGQIKLSRKLNQIIENYI